LKCHHSEGLRRRWALTHILGNGKILSWAAQSQSAGCMQLGRSGNIPKCFMYREIRFHVLLAVNIKIMVFDM
jgi:hypothetical protein